MQDIGEPIMKEIKESAPKSHNASEAFESQHEERGTPYAFLQRLEIERRNTLSWIQRGNDF